MSGTIINLILQIVAGAIGGNAAGGFLKNIDLSPLVKTISGAAGGGIGGSLLQSLIPALNSAASGGGFDMARRWEIWQAAASPARSSRWRSVSSKTLWSREPDGTAGLAGRLPPLTRMARKMAPVSNACQSRC